MKTYASNTEFFQDFESLVRRIDESGQTDAADCLRNGYASLNGLTDGWALLLESIVATISKSKGDLESDDLRELERMLKLVKKTVYR
jgi:hypothetical protein